MRLVLAGLVLMAATPALADESTDKSKDWSIAISGSASTADQQPDQYSGSIGLTRNFGNSYVRATVTRSDSGDAGSVSDALAAKTTQVTLGGGTSFGALSIDVYAVAGQRSFDVASFRRRNGNLVTLDSSGSVYGGGGTLTYDVPIGEDWFASPFVAVDYNRVDTARVINPLSSTPIVREDRQTGVTGSGGVSAGYLYGSGKGHSIGAYAAFVTTSNAAAINRVSGAALGSRFLSQLSGTGGSDSWFEYGAQAGFALGGGVYIDASAVRTAGLDTGESTSGTLGLRFAF